MPREIEVREETIEERINISNEVSIEIDGIPYRLWQNVEINFTFDKIADTFSLSGPWQVEDFTVRNLFKPFTYKEIIIYVGGNKVLTGILLNIRITTTANAKTIQLDGYSKPGILADVTVSSNSWPVTINGLDLLQIATLLARPFGIKVIMLDFPGPRFEKNDKVDLNPDQKIYDFLIGLARERGFVISSDVEGNMLFQRTTQVPATVNLVEGSFPYKNSSIEYNGQKRYSDITAINMETKKGSGQTYTVFDPELKLNGVNRPLTFKAKNTNIGNLVNAATSKWGRIFSESVSINITVIGWYPPFQTQIWKDNTRIVYRSDSDQIFIDTEFLIKNVKLRKNENTAEADLTLVFPEAYNNEIRSVMPWVL